jgi:hypothetical protein
LDPAPRRLVAYTSANSAREDLKPVVEAFAMLFEITPRSAVAALIPEMAVLKVMMDLLRD